MSRVNVEIEEEPQERRIDICATCTRCGHQTESYGNSDASVKRCLVLMREECPKGENNFYVTDYEGEYYD